MKYVLLVALLLAPACAPKPADLPSRPPEVQRAFVAKDVLDQVKVLSETAIVANQQRRISDTDTGYVRDFVLATTSALEAYVPGGTTYGSLVGVRSGFVQLKARLSPDARSQLDAVLRLLQAAINGVAPPNGGI